MTLHRPEVWHDSGLTSRDISAGANRLGQAEDILLNRGTPICPLYFYMGIQIYDSQKLGGIEPNLLDEHPFRGMYRK